MEKDFNKEVFNSEGENVKEDEELAAIEKEMILIATQRSLNDGIETLQEQLYINRKAMEFLGNSSLHDNQSLVSPVSPIRSIYESEEKFENSPDSTILEGSIRLLDNVSNHPLEVIQFKNNSKKLEKIEKGKRCPSNLPPKTPDKENQATVPFNKPDNAFTTPTDQEIIEKNAESSGSSGGKGKEAARKLYRYRKGSKSSVSPSNQSVTDSSVQHSEETFRTSESKSPKDSPVNRLKEVLITPESQTLKSQQQKQSPKSESNKNSSGKKRKMLDFNVEDPERQYSDESFPGTSAASILSRSSADDYDDSKIAKKLKFEDEENVNKHYPSLTTLLSEKNYERFDLEDFMDQPQKDQSPDKSEEWNLPSTSGLPIVINLISSDESLSLSSGSDSVLSSEWGKPSLISVSDLLRSESREPSLPSVSQMLPDEREDSSLTSVSDMSYGDRGDPSLTSVRQMLPDEREDSSLTSVSDMSYGDRGDPSLTSVSDISVGERGDPSLASVSDMSRDERGASSVTSISEDLSLSESDESDNLQRVL